MPVSHADAKAAILAMMDENLTSTDGPAARDNFADKMAKWMVNKGLDCVNTATVSAIHNLTAPPGGGAVTGSITITIANT